MLVDFYHGRRRCFRLICIGEPMLRDQPFLWLSKLPLLSLHIISNNNIYERNMYLTMIDAFISQGSSSDMMLDDRSAMNQLILEQHHLPNNSSMHQAHHPMVEVRKHNHLLLHNLLCPLICLLGVQRTLVAYTKKP